MLAHDGFYTATSRPISVRVPTRAPSADILYPRKDAMVQAGSTLRLWGDAAFSSNKPDKSNSARWLIDGKEVAHGLDAFITAPAQGQHRCTLIVTAGGKKVEKTHTFKTVNV